METKLKTPRDLRDLTYDELYAYIDKLHGIIREYQIVIDVAISKNQYLK